MTTVRVSVSEAHGVIPTLEIAAMLPHVGGAEKVASEIGIPSLQKTATEEILKSDQFKKFKIFQDQVKAARERVAKAERVFAEARAAKVLLESNPEPDFAAKLNASVARVAAAQRDYDAAKSELAVLVGSGLFSRHWVECANEVNYRATIMSNLKLNELLEQQKVTREEIQAACEKIESILKKALEEHLYSLTRGQIVLSLAVRAYSRGEPEILAENIRDELLVEKPDDVDWNGKRFVLRETSKPPEEPEPNAVYS